MTEIQKQCCNHEELVQGKVKKLDRLIGCEDNCAVKAEPPGETLVAELPDVPLLDCRTHGDQQTFASKDMRSKEFSIFNTMFRSKFSDEDWVKAVSQHPAV